MTHPLNAGFRFLLEIAAIIALWVALDPPWLSLLAIFVAMVAWGALRVPDDPRPAPIAVPGWLRLLLELGLFAASSALLIASGAVVWGGAFASLVLVHYLLDLRRVRWLLTEA